MEVNNNNLYLVSIIIPYFNSRIDFFIQAIESVLAQSYKKWETIIVNDGSTVENAKNLTEHIKNLNDKRFRLVNLPKNHGVAFARNTGISESKGDIIIFLDADDLYFPWYLEEIINYFTEIPDLLILSTNDIPYLSIGRIKLFNLIRMVTDVQIRKFVGAKLLEMVKNGKELLLPRISFKREVSKKIKYDCEFLCSEDTEFTFQIISNNDLLEKLIVVPTLGYIYRLHPTRSRLSLQKTKIFKHLKKLRDKYKVNPIVSSAIKNWELKNDFVRFCQPLSSFFDNASVVGYLKGLFMSKSSFKEKLKGIRVFSISIIIYNLFIPAFGINYKYIKNLLNAKNNKILFVKEIFEKHIKSINNENEKYYASKLFKKIF